MRSGSLVLCGSYAGLYELPPVDSEVSTVFLALGDDIRRLEQKPLCVLWCVTGESLDAYTDA